MGKQAIMRQESRSRLAILLCLIVLATASSNPCAAQSPEYITDAIEYDTRWERDRKRDQTSKPAEILPFTGLKPGMQVLDLFAGGGYWSEIFSRVVGPSGKVVAHTNAAFRKFSREQADKRFADNRLSNVEILLSEMNDLQLGHERFDLIFLGLVYHDLYFHAAFWPQPGRDYFLAQLRAALKPGGKLVVIDHAAAEGTGAQHAQDLHRIDKLFARRDIEARGFTFEAETQVLVNSDDDHTLSVFDDKIRRRTDRFVYRFAK